MDWNNCIICGVNDSDLRCPCDKSPEEALKIYGDFLENVEGFREIEALPVDFDLGPLETATEFLNNRAKWHRACYIKFAPSKLERTRERHKKKRKVDGDSGERNSKRRSLSACSSNTLGNQHCIFCLESYPILHNCSTMTLDEKLREMAVKMQDTTLLARISGGDLVAIEAKYHKGCLTSYTNRYRGMERKLQSENVDTAEDIIESQVFAELVFHIETHVEDGTYIFRLAVLHELYEERLYVLGLKKTINKTRLKKRLLTHFMTGCQEQTDERSILLVFNEGMQKLLREAIESRDFEQDALSMSHVSKIIRKQMLDNDYFQFSGTFPPGCQVSSVPSSLKSLVSMLLYGPNIKEKNVAYSKACLTICQLIMFNCKERVTTTTKMRHAKNREPPLPLYIGLDVHTHTRSKKMLTQLYNLGISVSYERVLEVEEWFTTALCQRYTLDDYVCPTQVRGGLFTAGALDNIDHNPSSATAQGSFHGTSISIFQFPTATESGVERAPITVPPAPCTTKPSLPDSYRIVPAVSSKIDNVTVPIAVTHDTTCNLEDSKQVEYSWIKHSIPLLAKEQLEKGDYIAWSAYHASCQPDEAAHSGIGTLLPLFEEKAATLAMVKHGMGIIKDITARCNPGQIPVLACDQPIFALAKYVQWLYPEILGEGSYIVMLGGLHVEMALWRMIGDLLERSGWTTALTESGIVSSGTADSFITVSHITKTRHFHQVTALCLAKLAQEACQDLHDGSHDEKVLDEWRKEMIRKSPTFMFWDLILRLETLVLIFVRSHRERNLFLYIEVMEALVPYFFALDHVNYARWLPVHIRDMKSLPQAFRDEFQRCWAFPKTHRRFSAMPLDQAHEQNNKIVKDSGGAVGLTENRAALKRWMVAGPEQARLIREFQDLPEDDGIDYKSHEQSLATQKAFKTQVTKLCETISAMGNPFLEDTAELMTLDTHDCVGTAVVDGIHILEKLGRDQYSEYVKNVLENRTHSIHCTIKKNRLPLFKCPIKITSKSKQKTDDLKSDCNLFSQLFVACQVRQGDLGEFFSYENHPWPPSLSNHGKIRLPSSKSELLECLSKNNTTDVPKFDAKVFDGAAIIHSLHIGDAVTFGDYSSLVFIPWTKRQLYDCTRIDVVWDIYKSDSLKEATREKRGKGTRRKVSRHIKIPGNFPAFLRDSTNKEELFTLLTEDVGAYNYAVDKAVYITSSHSVVSKSDSDPMPVSDHEEADTRICLHVLDAVKKGATSVMVSTVDTDVLVILVGIFHKLTEQYPDTQLWVAFGKGKHFRYYHVNSICNEIGKAKSEALPFFHAFTGSDTTSQFCGKGKKSAWKAWMAYPAATDGFLHQRHNPFKPLTLSSAAFTVLERFTCIMYDHTVFIM